MTRWQIKFIKGCEETYKDTIERWMDVKKDIDFNIKFKDIYLQEYEYGEEERNGL